MRLNLFLAAVAFIFLSVGLPERIYGAQIVNLPKYTGPNLTQYSGYITIDESTNKNLFYWLIESQGSPETDPLVVWLQGGPGCSSLFGNFLEHGPFRLNAQGNVNYTNLSWTQSANMLYIEAPAGVGFSYTNQTHVSDNSTADDNYSFLQHFLDLYPQYVGRDLWISGESYAGVYVPTLAYRLLTGNSSQLRSQFTGMLIGNPVIGCQAESVARVAEQFKLYYWHGLVAQTNYNNFTAQGCFENDKQNVCYEIFNNAENQIGVIEQQLKMEAALDNFASLDPDDLFQDFCTGNSTLAFSENLPGQCAVSDDLVEQYLNLPEVQSAIHAQPTQWHACNPLDYSANAGTMLPYYESIFQLKPSLRILVYSGDLDIGTCPFAFTMQCLDQLKRPRVSNWGPWFVNGATTGYFHVFDRFTYATVKGAGHEVPLYQPLSAYHLFSRFVTGQPLVTPGDIALVAKRASSVSMRQGSLLRRALPPV